jgi:hypothetical protein
VTLSVFFENWWMDHAMVELKRSTLAVYRCLWEAHAAPRLGALPIGDIDARRVVRFRAELLSVGVGPTSGTPDSALRRRMIAATRASRVASGPHSARSMSDPARPVQRPSVVARLGDPAI